MQKTTFSREYDLLRRMVREMRQRQGVTQQELATRLEETQSFVSKCERGERRLDFVHLRAFCSALRIPMTEFVAEFERRLGTRSKR